MLHKKHWQFGRVFRSEDGDGGSSGSMGYTTTSTPSGASSYFGGGYTGAGFSSVGGGSPASDPSSGNSSGTTVQTPSGSQNPGYTEAPNESSGTSSKGYDASTNPATDPQSDTSGIGIGSINANGTYSNGTGQKFEQSGAQMGAGASFLDSIKSIFSPQTGSLAYRLGMRAPGTSSDDTFDTETERERNDRMGLVGDAIGRVGQLAISAIPGGSIAMTIAKAADAAQNKGMSTQDAIQAALFDMGGGLAAGKINGVIGKAMGPDVSNVTDGYNKIGSLINLASPGSMPAFNPGASAVGYARTSTGTPSLGGPSGMTTPSGEPVQSFDGVRQSSSNSNSGIGQVAQAVPTPQAAPAATPIELDLSLFGRGGQSGWTSATKKYVESRSKRG